VLQRFSFQFSSPQPTPVSTAHSFTAPTSDESVEPSGPYPELVGCLITLGMGLVLGGRGPIVLTSHVDASWVDDSATQRSSQGYTFSLGSSFVSWQSTRSSLVLSSICEAEIYAGAMAAHELRWLTYLLTDLGEQPRSPLVLPIEVVLLPGTEKECCIRLNCGVSESEDYDILVGMELLYRVGATICTWQEKVLYRVQYWDPESSVGTLGIKFSAVCILELYGGIGTGLATALKAGCFIRKWVHVEKDPVVRRMARHHALKLLEDYPQQMLSTAISAEEEATVDDVRDITEEKLEKWGQVDLVVAGWEC
ncbi:unnamed protein product, partial [Closterium sp. NIES-54]